MMGRRRGAAALRPYGQQRPGTPPEATPIEKAEFMMKAVAGLLFASFSILRPRPR